MTSTFYCRLEGDDRSEIFDKYYQLGSLLFEAKNAETTINIVCELADVHVGLSTETNETDNNFWGLAIYQGDKGETEGVTLLPVIDRDDACRLAGMLMAWADCDAVQGGTAIERAKEGV